MSTANHKCDIRYMKKALAQAQKALAKSEVPIGAIVVGHDGKILARGYNQVHEKHQQIYHAEMTAISKASKKIGDWRLNDCTLYVTLEPCMMCMGLVRLSRLKRVVFGARSHLFGYQLDKEGEISLYNLDIEIQEGILAEDAAQILKKFLKQKRK